MTPAPYGYSDCPAGNSPATSVTSAMAQDAMSSRAIMRGFTAGAAANPRCRIAAKSDSEDVSDPQKRLRVVRRTSVANLGIRL